jgi:hypothetical protein
MAAEKFDLFGAFRRLNSLDFDFWDSLTPEERKQVSPYVFTMWMQNSKNDGQVLYLNEFVNPHLFTTLKGKEDIAFILLSLSSRGKQNQYSWVKRPSNKDKSAKADKVKEILMEYFEESEKNIGYYLQKLLPAEFVGICEDLGFQDDEIKKLKKEFEKAQAK